MSQPNRTDERDEGRFCHLSYVENQITHTVSDVAVVTHEGPREVRVPQGLTPFELEAARSKTVEETERRARLIHERVLAIKGGREREIVAQAVRELGL